MRNPPHAQNREHQMSCMWHAPHHHSAVTAHTVTDSQGELHVIAHLSSDTVHMMFAELVLQSALHFLSTEVPRWEQQNHCYSCHNNGDAARALYLAKAR